MNPFEQHFQQGRKIVPVIALPTLDVTLPLMDILAENGFNVVEITLRTDCAVDAIALLIKERPQLVVGAGTVKNAEQLQAVLDVGARFVVCPGLDLSLAEKSRQAKVPLIPGIMTPTELMQAENAGIDLVKLFPATLAGGIDFLSAMQPVFPTTRFFPTGGITETTAMDFLRCVNVACIGGSWLTPAKLLQQRDWAGIRAIAERCP
ncbi:MAG TPA: bifunctional 4-hydroxy-2-oxoglutarate aldolase/2-dehydro-3-deoxy-phosphogluconate aldolase [Dongiaceae bacterium]|nr:bifunctional 4-hydroxy-2-oxoglutarate aldolase/2-dehydro-3-deoxy-phosphogluconate aldolase [Dongiaceae bacterium]